VMERLPMVNRKVVDTGFSLGSTHMSVRELRC